MKFNFIETPSFEELQSWEIETIWTVETLGVLAWMERAHKKLHWVAKEHLEKNRTMLICPLFAGIKTSELQVYDIVNFDVRRRVFVAMPEATKNRLNDQFYLKMKPENKPEI